MLRKVTISAVMSVCLSVRLSVVRSHEITRLPLDGLSRNLISQYFAKTYRENLSSIKMLQELRVLYKNMYVHL